MLFRSKDASRQWLLLLAVSLGLYLGISVQAEPVTSSSTNLVWKFNFSSTPNIIEWLRYGRGRNPSSSTPAIGTNGTVYVGSFNGTLFAINPDGKEKWRFKAGLEIHSSPAVGDDGTVYFGSRDRGFYALTPNGKLKWRFATGGWVDSSPAIARDGTVYFGSWDTNFYALNPAGTLKWKFDTGAIVDSSPAVAADGTIYFGSHDRNLYALNPDGTVRWKFQTGAGIVSSPAIGVDGAVYFSSLDGNLYALNLDGSVRWRYHSGASTASSPVLNANGNIAIGINDRTDILSPDGHLLGFKASPIPVEVCAAAVDGEFYASVPWRMIMAVETGDPPLWMIEMHDNASSSLTIGDNGTIYVSAYNNLYALRPPGKVLPAAGPWPMFRGNARHTGRAAGNQ